MTTRIKLLLFETININSRNNRNNNTDRKKTEIAVLLQLMSKKKKTETYVKVHAIPYMKTSIFTLLPIPISN